LSQDNPSQLTSEPSAVTTSAPATTQKTAKPLTTAKALILSLCLSIISSVGSVAVYDFFFAQKIAVLDMQGFLADQKKLLADGKITGAELIQSLDRVEVAIDKAPKNTMVILKDVVLRNAASEIVP